MQQVEPVLCQSIDQYEHILAVLQKIDGEVGAASPYELQKLAELLTDAQMHAARTDRLLMGRISNPAARTETMQPLIDKRDRIIKEILLLNERITAKASGVKSLLAHEMGNIRTGISALNGYRHQQLNQGRIVNSTS